jgi:predicted nucleic acid-binding protein
MNCLFDSSAIFRAIKENRIEVLAGNYTLELARYELGNIIWKEYALQLKISKQESKLMMKTVKQTLNIMNVLGIEGNEEEILETSIELKTTFYDASYAYFAKTEKLRLITEDSRLIKKITSAVDVSRIDDIK